jgi:hypothetical protein
MSSPPTADATAVATISGKITRHIGGPLGGVVVQSGTIKTSSDRNGEYALKVPVGKEMKAVISFTSIGFLTETREVEVAAGSSLALDLTMGMGLTTLEGHVYDKETGSTLAGAYVSIETARTYTDEEGYFVFRDVNAITRYPITVYKDGFETKMTMSEKAEPGKPLKCDVLLERKALERAHGE